MASFGEYDNEFRKKNKNFLILFVFNLNLKTQKGNCWSFSNSLFVSILSELIRFNDIENKKPNSSKAHNYEKQYTN